MAVGPDERMLIEQRTAEMSTRGLRVIALAYRTLAVSEVVPEIENHLVFVALVGLADPLRPEARQAVEKSRSALDQCMDASAGDQTKCQGEKTAYDQDVQNYVSIQSE